MEKAKIKAKITGFIFENFPQAKAKKLEENEPLLVNGILDSLGVLDVVSFLEKEFGISIDDGELTPENFQSILSMTEFLECKVRGDVVEKS